MTDTCKDCKQWGRLNRRVFGRCSSTLRRRHTQIPLHSVVEGNEPPFEVHQNFGCIFHEKEVTA